jgi:hypothetical protein
VPVLPQPAEQCTTIGASFTLTVSRTILSIRMNWVGESGTPWSGHDKYLERCVRVCVFVTSGKHQKSSKDDIKILIVHRCGIPDLGKCELTKVQSRACVCVCVCACACACACACVGCVCCCVV